MKLVNPSARTISESFGLSEEDYATRFFEPCKTGFIQWQKDDEDKRDVSEFIEGLRLQIQPATKTEHFFFGFAISSILEQAKQIVQDSPFERMMRALSN